VAQLTRLVNDLLEASRVATGKIVLNCEPVDVAAIVKRCLSILDVTGHHLEAELQSAWVDADETRMEQVVTNLLTNALKYTPPAGRVAVSLRTEGEEIVLRVSDTGVGIAPDMLRRVFDLFVQGERSLDRSQGGLGIGLTLARRIVELHGGTITAESAGTGRGSTFTVRLPPVPARASPEPEAPVVSRERPRRILIVEDHVDAREMLCEALQTAGHDVHQAIDGPSGVETAERIVPDVALIDIGLPGLDGYATAARIRGVVGRRPLLIALTGYGRPEDRDRAVQAGFDVHLTKPVDPFYLLQLIHDCASTPAN
jgi:CheY-like chemotaxis protein